MSLWTLHTKNGYCCSWCVCVCVCGGACVVFVLLYISSRQYKSVEQLSDVRNTYHLIYYPNLKCIIPPIYSRTTLFSYLKLQVSSTSNFSETVDLFGKNVWTGICEKTLAGFTVFLVAVIFLHPFPHMIDTGL